MTLIRNGAASRKHVQVSQAAALAIVALLLSPLCAFADPTERTVQDIRSSLKNPVPTPKGKGITCENTGNPTSENTADASVFNHRIVCKKVVRFSGGKNGKQPTTIYEGEVARSVKNDDTIATETFTEWHYNPGETPESPEVTQVAHKSITAYNNAPVDDTSTRTGTITNNTMIIPSYREVYRKQQPHWHGEVFGTLKLDVKDAAGAIDKREAVVIGWRDEPLDDEPVSNLDFLNDILQENLLPDVIDSGTSGLDAGFVSLTTKKEEHYKAYFNKMKIDKVIFDDTYNLVFSKTERLDPLAGFDLEGSILRKQTYYGQDKPKEQRGEKIAAEKESGKTLITRTDTTSGPAPSITPFEISDCEKVNLLTEDIRSKVLTPIMNGLDAGLVHFKSATWQKEPSLPKCTPK